MARPRNERQREAIRLAAWHLFLTEGYEKATYAAIAAACDISKELVRHYYPCKEELAIEFKQAVLCAAEQAVEGLGITAHEGYRFMYAVGCACFEFLLSTAGSKSFLLDLIANRDLAERAIAFNADWALAKMPYGTEGQNRKAARSVIMQLSGFAGLLYHCMRHNESFDVEEEFKEVIISLGRALGDLNALGHFPANERGFAVEMRSAASEIWELVLPGPNGSKH